MDNISKRESEKILKEKKIINTAEKLFCTNGFENTSMNELAKECVYTKRTIYKYFTSKEDLYFAVLLKSYEPLLKYIEDIKNEKISGFEKIKSCYLGFNNYTKENPNMLSLMATGQSAKIKTDINSMSYRTKFYEVNNKLFKEISELFEEGQKDNSIVNNYESLKLAYTSIFSMTGFFFMLSFTGETFTHAFNLDKSEFINFSIELLTNSFKQEKSL